MTLNIISIILAVVAVVVTVIGFFASLKFYRDGMNLQSRANDALSKIAEKADSIHSQVGGMFDKTLDAALGRSDLKSHFEALNEQLENTADAIVNSAVKQIGTAGEEEKQRLSSVVNEQIGLIRERVQETRESAEQFAELQMPNHIKDNLTTVLDAIYSSKHPLTSGQIVSIVRLDKKTIRRVLATLSQQNRIRIEHDPKTNIHLFSPNPEIASESKT